MATQLPPPSKRQKRQAQEKANAQQEPEPAPAGSIRIRFVDQATNEAGELPVVAVPLAQSSVKNLELLLNNLQGQEDPSDRIPYRFSYRTASQKQGEDGEDIRFGEQEDLFNRLIKQGKAGTEEEVTLYYSPQAVFRVKAVSRCSAAISGHGSPILCTQFSPSSSSRLASGSGDSTARIWDCDTGTPVHTLKGHTSFVLAVAWCPGNAGLLATGSMDSTIRFWDTKNGQPLGGPCKGHSKWINSLSWEPYHLQQPDRPRVASASRDGTVRIWSAVDRQTDFVLSGHKGSVTCVKWGGTGRIYTASHDKTVKIWDAATGRLIENLTNHAHWVNHLALSTDFALRTSYNDHTGSAPTSEAERIAKAKKRFEEASTFGGKTVETLASASDDLTIYLWNPLHSTKPVARLTGHQKQVNHVTFSPDGTLLASAGFDNAVKLWNAQDGKFICTLRGHVAAVYQCCFSPDSRLLVSASKDCTLKAWDVRTGKLKEDLPGHKDEVYAVDWAPDGGFVGSGGKDKQIRIWRN